MSEHVPRTKADTLFGKIALQEGLLTEAQLRECLALQSCMEPPVPPLGILLMRMGYIDEPKLQRIIDVQRERLRLWQDAVRARRDDNLFGKVVLRMGLACEEDVQACLEIQDELPPAKFKRLGDILVERGVLASEAIQRVLDFQAGLVLYCPGCDREYNMVLFNAGSKITCYQCAARIRVPEGKTVEELPAEADAANGASAPPRGERGPQAAADDS